MSFLCLVTLRKYIDMYNFIHRLKSLYVTLICQISTYDVLARHAKSTFIIYKTEIYKKDTRTVTKRNKN